MLHCDVRVRWKSLAICDFELRAPSRKRCSLCDFWRFGSCNARSPAITNRIRALWFFKMKIVSPCPTTALRTVRHWNLAHFDEFPLVSPEEKEGEHALLDCRLGTVLTLSTTNWIRSKYGLDWFWIWSGLAQSTVLLSSSMKASHKITSKTVLRQPPRLGWLVGYLLFPLFFSKKKGWGWGRQALYN